jgi:hypothetical protein
MLVACRLAGLSAREGHYAGVSVSAQFGGAYGCAARFFWCRRTEPPTASQPDAGSLERLVHSGAKN